MCDELLRKISNCCFLVGVLLGVSLLHDDDAKQRLMGRLNVPVDDLLSIEELDTVYYESGLKKGEKVFVRDYPSFYRCYLQPREIHLAVFSKGDRDHLIYDSRVNEDGTVTCLTDNVVYLYLNEQHYDLIVNVDTFKRESRYCMRCMRWFRRHKFKDSHVCVLSATCQRRYMHENCWLKERQEFIECSNCGIYFFSRDCYEAHLLTRVFRSERLTNRMRITPCQYLIL